MTRLKVENLTPIIIALLLSAIVLGAGLLVMSQLEVNTFDDATVSGESFTADNESFVSLNEDSIKPGSVTITNATDGTSIGSENFTLDNTADYRASSVKVTLDSYNGETMNASYTYGTGNVASTINTTQSNLSDFAGWFAIIVVVVASAVILGIVVTSFKR